MGVSTHETAMKRAKDYIYAEGMLLAALIDVDLDRTFEEFGHTHLTPYCTAVLGLSEAIAASLVRVVRKTHDVPELGSAVMSGEVSLYKAKAIVSVLTPENHIEWIEKAKSLSKFQLEKVVAKASGDETKPITLHLSFDAVDRLRRNQELLSTKLGKFAT